MKIVSAKCNAAGRKTFGEPIFSPYRLNSSKHFSGVSRFCMLLHDTAGHCRIVQKYKISCKNGSRFCMLLEYPAKTGPFLHVIAG